MNEKHKQSLILGGLTSSAGVFLTKAIGILYVIPFSALATEANLSYYARAYNIYGIILNISIAGLPFALATMVAKYMLKERYKTVLLVRRLSLAVLALIGFAAMLALIAFAHPIAQFSISGPADSLEVLRTRNVMMIMALAVFTVPLLSNYRGFYQGLKELKVHAFSQVFEQLARVAFLLGIGFLLVVIFRMDAIWAVYAAILSTSVSAVASIVYFIREDRKTLKAIKEKAEASDEVLPPNAELYKELFYFAVPFMLNVVLNNSSDLVNLMFFNKAMLMHGETIQSADLYYSMIMFTSNKLTSIPQAVAPGFITAIIPYVTVSFEKKDFVQLRAHVLDTIDAVFYFTLPLAFFLLAISTKIYYVMYGAGNATLGGEVLAYDSITGLTFSLAAVSNALMMALRLRKQNLAVSAVAILLKFAIFVPLIAWLGYRGSIYSDAINQGFLFFVNLFLITRTFKVHYGKSFRNVLGMLVGLAGMQLLFLLLDLAGLKVVGQSRLIGVIQLIPYGILGLLLYFLITSLFQLPQQILHISPASLYRKLKGKIHAS